MKEFYVCWTVKWNHHLSNRQVSRTFGKWLVGEENVKSFMEEKQKQGIPVWVQKAK